MGGLISMHIFSHSVRIFCSIHAAAVLPSRAASSFKADLISGFMRIVKDWDFNIRSFYQKCTYIASAIYEVT